jgi:hypothetical protein
MLKLEGDGLAAPSSLWPRRIVSIRLHSGRPSGVLVSKKLSKSQTVAMNWLSKGWKAYTTGGSRVEVNGNPVGTVATLESLEKLGLVERLGVAAWEASEAGKAWGRAPLSVES